jgi:hypothetical protein
LLLPDLGSDPEKLRLFVVRTGNRKFLAARQLALELYLSIREMVETREQAQEQELNEDRLAALVAR